MSATSSTARAQDSYLDLVRAFPLRPIKDDAAYDAAVAVMNRLAVRGEASLGEGEADYLDTLSLLVERYDDEHHAVDTSNVTPLQALLHVMEASGTSQAELAKVLGVGKSAVSMILSGDREITADHARRLGRRFRVDPGLFI